MRPSVKVWGLHQLWNSGFTLFSCVDTIVAKDYCSVELTEEAMKAFVYAIKNHYWYQMYLGKLSDNYVRQIMEVLATPLIRGHPSI